MPKVWNKRDPNVPKDAVYVGRPFKWSNPFIMRAGGNLEERMRVLDLYKTYILDRYLDEKDNFARDLVELKGKDLVCWCAPKACHADILLKLANED